ncbi:MAG: phospholipase, partial [Porphyromonas sp.]|nr:phospholipase [Porphyromonas sp.]
VEEFRDVLLTLDADEVPAWVRSLQLRGVEFPETLRPELYLIVGENRDYHAIVGRHEPSPAA